jgi:hypothetical protein
MIPNANKPKEARIMARLAELRREAKDMGIAAAVIRRATTASELQSVISDHSQHNGTKPRKKAAVKKAVRKATVKAPARKVSATKPRAKKASGRKASVPAKSTRATKAKRPSNSNGSGYVPKGGRNLLDHVDYSQAEGWNARNGSAPDRIIKALKRFRGNRTKVFEFLKPDVWDFVGKIKTNGEKRTKAEALDMLKYRVSRTAWDFAMRTGQHEKAGNRVEYGTGGTGAGTWKPAKKTKTAQKRSTGTRAKATRKPTRKPATAQKRSQGRAKATTRTPRKQTRGRGRAKATSRR